MSGESWVALTTGIIAALVGIVGFLLNQVANRRERKSKIYAEALEAVQEYAELPFRVRRRASEDGPTRAALGDRISDLHAKLTFYRRWLQIDSDEVSSAYEDFVDKTTTACRGYWSAAWKEPILTEDKQAPLMDARYVAKFDDELKLCLSAMRHELSSWASVSRPMRLAARRVQRAVRQA